VVDREVNTPILPFGLLAEGIEGRAESLFVRIFRGAYATIAIIVSP